ncbi:MAG TPA: maleylacetate reductase [Nakamurella sp.]|nr:maleylacetate reductase [Nakamurella sp.]
MRSAFGASELGIDPFVHEMPGVRVVFGAGRIDQVAAEAARLGGTVLLIAGRRQVREADRVATELGQRCVGRINEVTEHVPAELAQQAVDLTREVGAGTVVCLGGGSAVGLAKAVALQLDVTILAVPTTYAGSEQTPIWGRTEAGRKVTGRDARVLPRTVVYDPALTVDLPAGLSAASGMNAIAHAVEAAYAPDASPVTALLAAEAIGSLSAALPVVVREPANMPARERALYGAWLAGTVLGVTTMGLHHKLAHVIGGSYRLPHAGTHSALLPHVVAFNAAVARTELSGAARAAGAAGPDELGAALFDLATAIGAPTSLSGLGLPDTAIDDVVDQVLATGVANPRSVDAAGLAALVRDALVGRRPDVGPSPGVGAQLGRAADPAAHRVSA